MARVETPVFLVGCERSGTTLLRLMLDHHPAIAFAAESEYMVSEIGEDGRTPDMARYREWLAGNRVFQARPFTIDPGLDYEGLVNDFLLQKKARDGKDLVGATVHHHFSRLRRLWPRARYVYLYRDGRDVASSVVRMGWAGDVYLAADRWLEAEREWDALRRALAPADWIEVRYEELIESSRPVLERLCAFLGVGYSERMFDYVGTSTYDAPDPALNYQWRTAMRKADLQRLETKLGSALQRRGYPLSGYPPVAPSALGRCYLGAAARARTFALRLRRFGVALTLQEVLGRYLGLRRVHREAARRIDRIVNANLK